jgi:hypothetical protein
MAFPFFGFAVIIVICSILFLYNLLKGNKVCFYSFCFSPSS